MKEEKKKVGFFCSLPMCIILTYFLLPVGVILIFCRLYKKEKIKKKTRDTAIILIAVITAVIVFLCLIPSTDTNYDDGNIEMAASETVLETEKPTESKQLAQTEPAQRPTETTQPAKTEPTQKLTEAKQPTQTEPIEQSDETEPQKEVAAPTKAQEEKVQNKYELSQYAGKPLTVLEKALKVKIKSCTENTYSVEDTSWFSNIGELFRFKVDSKGNIVSISLEESGKKDYTLWGIHTDMEENEEQRKLFENGFHRARDEIWQSENGKDAMICELFDWTYELDSAVLQDALLMNKMESALKYQYTDSIGIFHIGGNTFAECYSNSYPDFMYEFESATNYQREAKKEIIDGRYVLLAGTVDTVTNEGLVSVSCKMSDEAVANYGTLGAYSYSASLNIIPEQKDLLITIDEDDIVLAVGRFDTSSHTSFLGRHSFGLADVILMRINGNDVSIPSLDRKISGLTQFDKNGELIVWSEDSTEQSEDTTDKPEEETVAYIDEEIFWESHEWYSDNITGSYNVCSEGLPFDITAGADQDGNITYWLLINSEKRESLAIPSYKTEAGDWVRYIYFDVSPYTDMTGEFVFRVEEKYSGDVLYTINANVGPILDTWFLYLDVEKIA